MPRVASCLLALAAPLVFGLLSVALGQDANWDLRNYHRYDPWALLDGRLRTDLAPAGMPSYFNPLLDLPYYVLSQVLPGRVLAFAMGAWHGVNAPLLYAIGRAALPDARDRVKLLAFAGLGCLGSAFLSEIGNTMGDDTTAPFLLAALALVLHAGPRTPTTRFVVAGLVAGAGIGLKLTNAPYGLALLVAMLVSAAPSRVARAAALALGLAIGVAFTFGPWAVTLQLHFGNPFFPQFNALFGSPLAAATSIVDDKWFASGPVEALLFPFVFTLFPMRIHEIPLANPLWPLAYGLFLAAAAAGLVRMRASRSDAPSRTLFAFAIVAYLAWLLVFSIGRYLIVLELLLPLLVWLLSHRLFRARVAAAVACAGFVPALALPFVHFETWGNAPFAELPYRVDAPTVVDPALATVLVLTAPVAWTLPDFPRELAFVGRNGSFPESPGYRERVRSILDARGGPIYALLPADTTEAASGLARMNAFLERHEVRADDLVCRYAKAALANAPAKDVVFDEGNRDACRFRRDIQRNRLSDRDAATIAHAIEADGLHVDLATCTIFRAWLGATPFDYRFCPVNRDR